MSGNYSRKNGRNYNQLRPINIELNIQDAPDASLIWKQGETHVLIAVNLMRSVPGWLEGSEKGWITAEYQMLPGATLPRAQRERKSISGRTQEIQRLIGRSLRAVFDLTSIQGMTIMVDCDVIKADGGTRTASICGGFLALSIASSRWLKEGLIESNPIKERLAAVSLGKVNSSLLLDLDYTEDSSAEVDFNLVMTENRGIIELQSTSEGEPLPADQLEIAVELGMKGILEIIKSTSEFQLKR
ncbi:MAG: ribonuclease PH [Candidatus Coatesbacteria bacterium]|nr:ribonuclease PH [Candidatus Coatesbacteria bacterium]